MIVDILDIVKFYDKHPECIGKLNTNTKFGVKIIEYADVTAYDSFFYTIELENGYKIEASPDHRLWSKDGWVKVKNLKIDDLLEIKNGQFCKINAIYKSSLKEDLYDLQIQEVKEFYANGIRSHNSTMLDALVYALYGKPFRKIVKGLLINSINKKEMLVELELSIGSNKYKIRRGDKPKIFEIYLNDVLIPQDSKTKEYQSMIETEIIKCEYKTFTQIIVLGSATYIPFMELKSEERRKVIEDILDIGVFSEILSGPLKEDNDELKSKLIDLKSEMSVLETKILMGEEHNEKIKSNNKSDVAFYENNKLEVIADIEALRSKLKSQKQKLDGIKMPEIDIQRIKDKLHNMRELKYEIEARKKQLNAEYSFFKTHDDCPTCNQTISQEFKTEKCENNITSITEIDIGLEKISKTILKHENAISDYNKIIETRKNAENVIKNIESVIEDKIKNLNTIENTINSIISRKNESLDFIDVSGYKKDLQSVMSLYNEGVFEKNVLGEITLMMKDNGIKSEIIKKFIPLMNELINDYLSKFDLYVNFTLDENFNETIKSRYRDTFSYESFSEGEKLRINLSIMLAWREIAKKKNSISTNLLIFDEILDGALDEYGVIDLVSALRKLEDGNANIFVISHRGDSLKDLFDVHLYFEKHKNFSLMYVKE